MTTTPLKNSLSDRQINMIAIGGIIGTGLFVGSGLLVQSAGPAVLLAYLAMGLVVVFVMRMLGELAIVSPDSGSYAAYASREFGPWIGAMCSYMAVYGGIVIVALECTIIGLMVTEYSSHASAPILAIVTALLLFAFNLLKVKFFAEIEFWLALVKVLAIISFLLLGLAGFLGFLPEVQSPGFRNWTPFVPNGWGPVAAACVSVLFAYVGAEQVVIMAAEAKDPPAATRQAIRAVVSRILLFFIGSLVVVVTFHPINDGAIAAGAYMHVLNKLGLGWLGSALNIIIIFSLLSLANTMVYTTSRMFFAAAQRRELPRFFYSTSSQGVPVRAILMIAAITMALVSINFVVPAQKILTTMMAFVGVSVVIAYTVIIATQMRTRSRMTHEQVNSLPMKMWLHPWGGILTMLALFAAMIGVALSPELGITVPLTIGFACTCAIAGAIVQKQIKTKECQDN